jgi:hypothetical protein
MTQHTRLIKGVKYLQLHNDNEFKKKSLEDNVYFTNRDIFLNIGPIDYVLEANRLNGLLSGDIRFEDRTENFKY